MKKLLIVLALLISVNALSQSITAAYYQSKNSINFRYNTDTCSFNGVVTFGTGMTWKLNRLYYYNFTTPAAGAFLKGNGTYYDNFPRGTANQLMRVNAGGTDVEWFTPSFLTLASLSATSPLTYNSGTGVFSTSMSTNKLIGRGTAGTGVMEQISLGTGVGLSGTTLNNTAPDQTVVLNSGAGISATGTYPNFTITNTLPTQWLNSGSDIYYDAGSVGIGAAPTYLFDVATGGSHRFLKIDPTGKKYSIGDEIENGGNWLEVTDLVFNLWNGTDLQTQFDRHGKITFYNTLAPPANRVLAGDGTSADFVTPASIGILTTATGVTNVTATSPLTSSGGTTPDIALPITSQRIVTGTGTSVAGYSNFLFDQSDATFAVGNTNTENYNLNLSDATGRCENVITGYGAETQYKARYANGSQASPTVVLNNDALAVFGAAGYDATGGFTSDVDAGMKVIAAENWSATAHGNYMIWAIKPITTNTLSKKMRLDENGLNVGAFSGHTYMLDVAGDCNLTTGSLYRINGTQIAASNLSNGTTGSNEVVLKTSPTLTTPNIGVATATSVNKMAITAPATSSTLAVADGKTFTSSNTLTFTGTDGSSVNVGAGGTVLYSGYTLQIGAAQISPADASTQYFGMNFQGAGTTADICRIYIPYTGTVKKIYIVFNNSGVLGTTETSTINFRYDNTTNTAISASVINNAATTTVSNTGLSIAVTADHYFEIQWACPTWATNPTNVRVSGTVYIE